MALIDHVENSGANLEIASGVHVVTGDPLYSRVEGVAPNHQIFVKRAIADGEWNKVLGIWNKGTALTTDNYHFHPGKLSSGVDDPLQGVCSFFPTGLTHSGTVCVCAKLPLGFGDPDTKTSPPNDVKLICETEKYPDFDINGNMIDFSYTANPARALVGNIMRHGKIRTAIPDTERYYSQYWKNRIDWGAWIDWRDATKALEMVDYTTLPNFDGIGLSCSFYQGTNFETFISKRRERVIDFQLGDGAPAFGMALDNYSIRCEGKIKFRFSEAYTLTLEHTNGARLWINDELLIDQWAASGTHTAIFNAVAGDFYDIKIEHFNGTGPANLRLLWHSASTTQQVIDEEYLYPKPELREKYPAHLKFKQATSIATLMRDYLRVSNSVKQEVDGKIRFFCREQLTPSFTFDESNIKTLTMPQRDIRDTQLQNVFSGNFLDIDSQFLQKATVTVQLEDLQQAAGRNITGAAIEYPNMTHWHAYKLLSQEADFAVRNLNTFEILATALSYRVTNSDPVYLTWADLNFVNKPCRVIEARDKSSEETAEDKFFILKETSSGISSTPPGPANQLKFGSDSLNFGSGNPLLF